VSTRVAFLRAVNLGSRKVPMSRLVEVCEELGYSDVWTHANSGNVVFDALGSRSAIERALEAASNDFDTLEVHGRDVHWRMRGKSTDTKLRSTTWKQVGERRSTSRNINLLQRLIVKLDG
jgi:uncharacterized protein (DUF1697 family)